MKNGTVILDDVETAGALTLEALAERVARLEGRRLPQPIGKGRLMPLDEVKAALEAGGRHEGVSVLPDPSPSQRYHDRSTVIVCPTRGLVDTRVVEAWNALIHPMNQRRLGPIFARGYEVGKVYDALISGVLDHPQLKTWRYVLTLEDDNLPPPDAHMRLLEVMEEHPEYSAVSGLYHTKDAAQLPMAYGDPEHFRATGRCLHFPIGRELLDPFGPPVEVLGIPMGCTLWRMDLFRDVAPSWFMTLSDQVLVDGTLVPHDQLTTEQCEDAKKAMTQDLAFCFPAGTWIYGKKVCKIEDVKKGYSVTSHMGASHKVMETVKRPYSGRMVRIIPYFGAVVESTPEHPFLVKAKTPVREMSVVSLGSQGGSQGGLDRVTSPYLKGAAWTEAGVVKEGDWLYIPKPRKSYNPTGVKKWRVDDFIGTSMFDLDEKGLLMYRRARKNALHVNQIMEVTTSLCRLIGYYVAEGYSSGGSRHKSTVKMAERRGTTYEKRRAHGRGKNNVVNFCFGLHEPDVVADCVRLLKECFPGVEPVVKDISKGGVSLVKVSSKILARLFASMCGDGARRKHFPRGWTKLSDECLIQMLKGYWIGDGSFNDEGDNGFRFTTVSERLAHETRHALLRLSIFSAIYTGTTPKNEDKFEVRTPLPMVERIGKIFGEKTSNHGDMTRTKGFKETKKHFKVRVRKVEEFTYEGVVYNMEVARVNSYTANGLAVHNCEVAVKKHQKRFAVVPAVRVGHLDTESGILY